MPQYLLIVNSELALEPWAGTTPTQLAPPTGLAFGAVTSNSLVINWNTVTNNSGYTLQYSLSNSFTSPTTLQVTGTTTTLTGLTAATTYYVRMLTKGTGSFVNSGYSTAIATATSSVGSYPEPAPTAVHGDDATNRIAFVRVAGKSFANFRWSTNGTTLNVMQDQRVPNNTSGSFLIGSAAYGAGTIGICEVDSSGVQISPFAYCPEAFTNNFVAAGDNLTGNSTDDEAGHISITDIRQSTTPANARGRFMLNQNGGNSEYLANGQQGWTWTMILAPSNITRETTTAYTAMGSRPRNGISTEENINSYCKDGWTPTQILNDGYQAFLNAITPSNVYDDELTLIVGPTDIIQVTTLDDGTTPVTYQYHELMEFMETNLPILAASFGIQALVFNTCPYIGAGAAVRGQKNNTYRDARHPGSNTIIPVPVGTECNGSLVKLSRTQAKKRSMQGLTVPNDLGTVSAVVSDNTVAPQHQSVWAIEYQLDGESTWQISQRLYVSNITNGVMKLRNVAEPSIVTQTTYSVNTSYQPETVIHARTVYAPDVDYAYYISQPLVDQAIVALKATGFYGSVALAMPKGGGVILAPSDGTGNPKTKALCGLNGIGNGVAAVGVPVYRATEHQVDFTQSGGSNPIRLISTLSPIAGDFVVVLDVNVLDGGYNSLINFNNEAFGLMGNGEEVWLTTASAAITAHIAGVTSTRHYFIIRRQSGVISLRLDTGAPEIASGYSLPGTNLVSSAQGGATSYGLNSSKSLHNACFIFAANVPDSVVNTFITALAAI